MDQLNCKKNNDNCFIISLLIVNSTIRPFFTEFNTPLSTNIFT